MIVAYIPAECTVSKTLVYVSGTAMNAATKINSVLQY